MALECVRDNIKAFGGDQQRIMLYGQSVGGLSTDYHAYAWPEDPTAASIFSISGTAASVRAQTPDLSSQYWYNLSEIVDCPVGGNAIPCMQAQSWQTLLASTRMLTYAPTLATFQPQFQETADEVAVLSDYADVAGLASLLKWPFPLTKSTIFTSANRIQPYLISNSDYEAGFYNFAAFAIKRSLT